jgi:hypothetical protein
VVTSVAATRNNMAAAAQPDPTQGGAPDSGASGASQAPANPKQMMLAQLYQMCKRLAQEDPVLSAGLAKGGARDSGSPDRDGHSTPTATNRRHPALLKGNRPMPKTVEEVLRETGMTDEQIKALDPKMMTGITTLFRVEPRRLKLPNSPSVRSQNSTKTKLLPPSTSGQTTRLAMTRRWRPTKQP